MTVMERFDLPGEHTAVEPIPPRWRPAVADVPAPSDVWDPDDAVPLVPSAAYDGLLAIGAVAGSALGVAIGATVGASGPASTLAILVGLDVGILVGAGLGGWLARRDRLRLAGEHEAGSSALG